MCKSRAEGGQRCAAHTRGAYESASFGTPEWDAAAAEYASTPSGAEQMQRERARADQAGQIGLWAALGAALHKGETMRAANQRAASVLAQARPSQTTPAAVACDPDDPREVAARMESADAAYAQWEQKYGPQVTEGRDAEGWWIDENGDRLGVCNSCGDETPEAAQCCEDGEVVPL